MLYLSRAKINLGLYVTNKREDGFHDIQTIFCHIGLYDFIEIYRTDKDTNIFNSGREVGCSLENNLVYKAYLLLRDAYHLPNLKIYLYKYVPVGAGLGGGSANAALTLLLLNKLFNLNLSEEQLINFARMLGSDCAFFIKNNPVYAYEKGDKMEDIELNMQNYKLVVIKPDFEISTADAYKEVLIQSPPMDLKEIIKLPVEEWKDVLSNNFEDHMFKKYPALKKIKEILYTRGAVYASMTGSGSAIYGIFRKEDRINFQIRKCSLWKDVALSSFEKLIPKDIEK